MKINGERHFTPSPENVSTALGAYGVALENYTIPKTGLENTTLLVASSLGNYALRVYRQDKKSDSAIENELELMRHLYDDSIPVPRVKPTKAGNSFARIPIGGIEWRAILMEALPGEAPNNYDGGLVDRMASLQAKMHESGESYIAPHPVPRVGVLHEQPFVSLIDQKAMTDPRLAAFLSRASQHTVRLSNELPHGWCHLDLGKGNLLTDESKEITGILDFDDAADVPYVMDLAYAMWAVRYFGNEQLSEEYRDIYEQSRPLSAAETSFLPQIMLYRHYVVSSMFILHGEHTAPAADRYLEIEQSLHSTHARQALQK